MDRIKVISEKLDSISDEEWLAIFNKLTIYVKFKLKGRTRYGAHSDANLGIDAINFYIEDAIQKLFEHTWDWKFEEYSLLEQLKRVIGSTISENVRKENIKKNLKERNVYAGNTLEIIPTDSEKLIWLAEEMNTSEDSTKETLEQFEKILVECSKDEPDLELLVMALLETDDSDEIAKQFKWDKSKLYTLQRKLYRRVRKYAEVQKIKF